MVCVSSYHLLQGVSVGNLFITTPRYEREGKTMKHDSKIKGQLSTADEVATMTQTSRSTIYRLRKQGVIPCVRLGRAIRFDLTAVLEALSLYNE